MDDIIAERTMLFKSKNGDTTSVNIRIGKPYPVGDLEWACPVRLDGLYNNLAAQSGIDSLQSLNLAIRLANDLLLGLEEDGGTFFFEDGAGPIRVSEIFK